MLPIPISLLLLRILINFNNVTLTAGDLRTHFECKSYCHPLSTANTRQDSTWITTEEKNYHYLLFYKYPPGGKRAKTRHRNGSYTSAFCICKGQSCCSFFSPTINNSNPLKVSGWREALTEHIWASEHLIFFHVALFQVLGQMRLAHRQSSPFTLDGVSPAIALFFLNR